MKCNNCGMEYNDNSLRFCKNCGTPFMGAAQNQGQSSEHTSYAEQDNTQLLFQSYGQTQLMDQNSNSGYANQSYEQAMYSNGMNQFNQNQQMNGAAAPSNNKKRFNPIVILIPLAVVILIAIGVMSFFYLKKDKVKEEPESEVEELIADEEPVQKIGDSGSDIDFISGMTILQTGELAPGEFEVSDEVFYYIDHNSDISYEEAFANKNMSNNDLLWGGFAYKEIKDYAMSYADYSVFNGKCMYFKKYKQDVNISRQEEYKSVVPVYSFCMMGNSREFAEATMAFMGYQYPSNDENPFYDATIRKQQRVYNNLIEEYGEELANEYFANYQKVLNSSFIVISNVTTDANGSGVEGTSTYGSMYIADLDASGDGTLSLVDVLIDYETFEMSIENPDHWITYDVDMADDYSSFDLSYADGSQIRLFRTSDKYLLGFVGSDRGAYRNIAGFGLVDKEYYLPQSDYSEEIKSELDMYTDFSFILMTDGTMAVDPVVTFKENNTVSVSFEEVFNFATKAREPLSVSFEARYSLIGCGDSTNGGFALTDSSGTYYYNYSQESYLRSKLDDEYVDNLDLSDIYALLTINARITGELVEGFKAENIDVTVDADTGNIILDNGVLFELDKSDLSDEGMEYLTKVGRVYSNLISDSIYADRVKNVRIDGYADPQGSYEHNQKLSEDRARAVMDYLAECYPKMTDILLSEGHSSDNPILAEDGSVDYAASRRVEIAFVIDMDEYMAEEDPATVALYGTFIGEEYGSKLELRSGGRGSFTNSGTTIPQDITWKVEGDTVVFTMPYGYDLYSAYDTDTLTLENEEVSGWKPDTFHRVE